MTWAEQQARMDKTRIETERKIPRHPVTIGGETFQVGLDDLITFRKLGQQERTTDIKNYANYVAQERVAGREPKSFEEYQVMLRREGATRIEVDYAGRAADVRKAQTEVDILGAKGWGDAVKKAEEQVKDEYFHAWAAEDDVALRVYKGDDWNIDKESEARKARAVRSHYWTALRAHFGTENVSPLVDVEGKGWGWYVKDRSGKKIWRGVPR